MFRNKVPCTGMQTPGKETGQNQVIQRVCASAFDEQDIEQDLGEDIEDVDGGEGNGVDENGSHGVEEDLEGAEKGLS